jgi:molybdopterin biosynthesis enzyme
VEIARGVAVREGDEVVVSLHERQGSGSLPSFVGINALVILPADQAELAAGELVETILWGPGLRSEGSVFDTLS